MGNLSRCASFKCPATTGAFREAFGAGCCFTALERGQPEREFPGQRVAQIAPVLFVQRLPVVAETELGKTRDVMRETFGFGARLSLRYHTVRKAHRKRFL